MAHPASIVIPTRERPAYLQVALSSIAAAAARVGAEVLVVDDAGPTDDAARLAARFGARYEPHPAPLGLNVARNTGVERSDGELVVFVDDDVRVGGGWLDALLEAAENNPDVDVLAGPIRAVLEGGGPHSCGREDAPITTLDLGEHDTDARYAWGANMAIRRSALERVGPFDVSLEHGGDEQEWQDRLRADTPGARVLYVAGAAVEHRRTGRDARLRGLCRGAFARGAAARRFDARCGRAPALRSELTTLARCVGHVLFRLCPAGLTMVAHSIGRVQTAIRERPSSESLAGAGPPSQPGSNGHVDDFLSGASGTVGGLDGTLRTIGDGTADAIELLSVRRLRLGLAARHAPPLRKVLVLGVRRPEHDELSQQAEAELLRSRHDVEVHTTTAGASGKFENLNRLLAAHPADAHDWLLVLDDDVVLPRGFLDRFLFLCERFSLTLAQPAHRLDSHAAWSVTRRRLTSVARETHFVEIGPVTAFARQAFPVLLPFPPLRMGWGLDVHWAALAQQHGWRCGVIDAIPIRHRAAAVASGYRHEDAIAEARSFLAERPYVSARDAQRTLATHRSW